MRGAFGAVVALALCAGGAARAAEEDADAAVTVPPVPDDRVGLTEHELHPAERTTAVPPGWDGDLVPAEVSPSYTDDQHVNRQAVWVTEGLARRAQLIQPLWVPPVTIDYAVRIQQAAGWNPDIDRSELDQLLYVGFGVVELYAPLFTLRASETARTDHFRANLKLPFFRSAHNAVSFRIATNLPVSGPLAPNAGYRAELGYSVGYGPFAGQVQGGYGSDVLLGQIGSVFRPSLFWDISLGYTIIPQLQVLVTADGRDPIEGRGTEVRVWPGVRIFPLGPPTMSIALSGLWWTTQGPTEWSTTRAGGMVEVGYLFF